MIPGSYALRVGEVVVSRGHDGVSAADALLFGSAPSSRTRVDRTTVGGARGQLSRAGYDPGIVALVTARVKSLSLGYVRPIADLANDGGAGLLEYLEAPELFDYRNYDGRARVYDGMWLHLQPLARDSGVAGAADILAAVRLASILDECAPDAPVTLSGATSFDLVPSSARPDMILQALDQMSRRGSMPPPSREQDTTLLDVLRRVREALRLPFRAHAQRLARLEAALVAAAQPTHGPLANETLFRLETRLALGDVEDVEGAIGRHERVHGVSEGSAYLKAYAAFLDGREPPKAVAARVVALAKQPFPELSLLAARALAAAGEAPSALAHARMVRGTGVRAVVATEAAKLIEALAAGRPVTVEGTYSPSTPLSTPPRPPLSTPPRPPPRTPPPPKSAASGSYSYVDPEAVARRSQRPPSIPPATAPVAAAIVHQPRAPALVVAQLDVTWPMFVDDVRPPADSTVETTPQLATGMTELLRAVTVETRGSSATERARELCTGLTRELALEVEARLGLTLETNASALAVLQKYLLQRVRPTSLDSDDARREIQRHGACLSEIIIRVIGGRWIDVSSANFAEWALFVSPGTRMWPFASVARFALQQEGRDLVSHYLELELRALRARPSP